MIIEQIKQDLLAYQKQGRPQEVSALRMLVASLVNKEKEKRLSLSSDYSESELEEKSKLTEEEILKVISSEAKKRKDSIESFKQGGRQDLVENEEKELLAIKKYLPEEMPEEEIKKIIEEVIRENNISDIKGMGMIMKETIERTKGRTDGSTINKIARDLLN